MPWISEITERVVPHEGQGILVIFFMKQAPTDVVSVEAVAILKNIQIYPVIQAIHKSTYSRFLLSVLSLEIV